MRFFGIIVFIIQYASKKSLLVLYRIIKLSTFQKPTKVMIHERKYLSKPIILVSIEEEYLFDDESGEM